MATIYKQIEIFAPANKVWEAVRDWGAVHRRLMPGLMMDVEAEATARTVTYEGGVKVRELIVGVDDSSRRLAYSAASGRAAHHNASLQVMQGSPGSCLLIWINDVLPDAALGRLNAQVEQGALIMKKTLEDACGV